MTILKRTPSGGIAPNQDVSVKEMNLDDVTRAVSDLQNYGVSAQPHNPAYVEDQQRLAQHIAAPQDFGGEQDFKRGGLVAYANGGGIDQYHGSGLFNSTGAGRTDILDRAVPPGGYVIPADVVSGMGEGNTLAGSDAIDRMMSTGKYAQAAAPRGQFADGGSTNLTMPTSPDQIEAMMRLGPGGLALARNGFRANAPRAAAPPSLPRQPSMGQQDSSQSSLSGIAGLAKQIGQTNFSKGGTTDAVPVKTAGGEHFIPPEAIVAKFGNLKRGHAVLDKFVVDQRKKTIKTMQKLPGPKK